MAYLLHIVLALLAQAAVEGGLASGWTWWPGVVLLAGLPYLLAIAARRLYLSGRFRWGAALHGLLVWSPPLLHLVALALLGWTATVERALGAPADLLSWPGPALLAALAPFVAYGLVSIDARARVLESHPGRAGATRGFHARMLLSGLAPLVAYVLLAWALGTSPLLRAHVEHAAIWSAAFAALLLLLLVVFLPRLLSGTWETAPLPRGPARDALEALARRARVPFRELLVWRTGEQMANAAVVGVVGRERLVLLSDALLAQLGPAELLAVFAHELGHVKRHHVLAFLAWALAFFLGADLLAVELGWTDELLGGAVLLAGLALWLLGFGYLSRRLELEADLYSAELLGSAAPIVAALEQVGGTHGRHLGSWRHFSTRDRVEFLLRAQARPELATRLRRAVRRWTVLGFALAGAVLALELRALVRQHPRDAVVVALSLGRYDQARERLARLDPPPQDLERVVRRAASLAGAGPADPAQVEERARQALRAGDAQAAVDWLRLAALRGGRRELDLAADVLVRFAEGDAAGAAGRLEQLRERSPTWAQELAAAIPRSADQ